MTRPSENGFETVSDYLSALEKWFEADRQLGAAWRRCEAALPEGASLELRTLDYDSRVGYVADAQGLPAQWAPTPTAALEALAAKLESL